MLVMPFGKVIFTVSTLDSLSTFFDVGDDFKRLTVNR